MSGIVNDMLVNKLFPKKQWVYENLFPASTLYPSNDVYPAGKTTNDTTSKKTALRFWFKKNSII